VKAGEAPARRVELGEGATVEQLVNGLQAADGDVYAAAQGPLTVGGYSVGGGGTSRQVNHPTVARIPGGGLVERAAALELRGLSKVSLLLTEESFTTAGSVAAVVNEEFGSPLATVIDARRVDVAVPSEEAPPRSAAPRVQEFPPLADIGNR
jgi:flagellar P-ring protein precursor FlgI